jgi:hypothetical protein
MGWILGKLRHCCVLNNVCPLEHFALSEVKYQESIGSFVGVEVFTSVTMKNDVLATVNVLLIL